MGRTPWCCEARGPMSENHCVSIGRTHAWAVGWWKCWEWWTPWGCLYVTVLEEFWPFNEWINVI